MPKMSHLDVFVAVGTYDSTVICLSFDAEKNVRKSRSQMTTVQNSCTTSTEPEKEIPV